MGFAVEADSCRHMSVAGLREAIVNHGDGTFTLKDGCRVRGIVFVPPNFCEVCGGYGMVPPGDQSAWPEKRGGEWRALVEFYGVMCPNKLCDDGIVPPEPAWEVAAFEHAISE